MKYVHNKKQPIFTTRFIINTILIDVVVIILVIIGTKLYNNYMITHDVKTINSWCTQVVCAVVDPNTGEAHQVEVEAVQDGQNNENIEVMEI